MVFFWLSNKKVFVLIKLFPSYISNRELFVSLNGYKSNLAAVRYELPQGSTLAIKYSNLHDLVDDTKLLKFNTRVDSIIKQAYQDLKSLS